MKVILNVPDGTAYVRMYDDHGSQTGSAVVVDLEQAPDPNVGELGLPFTVAGKVAQTLGTAAIERGNVTREQVARVLDGSFDEDGMWEAVGPFIDQIEDDAEKLDHGRIAR